MHKSWEISHPEHIRHKLAAFARKRLLSLHPLAKTICFGLSLQFLLRHVLSLCFFHASICAVFAFSAAPGPPASPHSPPPPPPPTALLLVICINSSLESISINLFLSTISIHLSLSTLFTHLSINFLLRTLVCINSSLSIYRYQLLSSISAYQLAALPGRPDTSSLAVASARASAAVLTLSIQLSYQSMSGCLSVCLI